ncbi:MULTISPECIES: alpha/beta hydrolase [Kitasatospora]|uniref:Putative esterase n=1 Tax=Kitasatospora setae (strain ATCC 33774 / DSM 43861 / JCM 3304 / KCC A-0304 / NBRC 14216 / KM-6054) TaxID=452652 RepID=E4N1U0_KITSK|nr:MULTISPECIES: alpha/beta hydrolase [Kitasatospora]BAJ32124.1 putative esterase [Kitasatospora setae KM-6054]
METEPYTAPYTAPYLDPEQAAALAARGGVPAPLTPDGLAAWQRRDAERRPRPTLRQLADGGRFEAVAHDADGVPVVTARPAGADGALPALLYLHGGGLIGGNAYAVLPRVLRESAEPLGLAVLSVDYPLAPAARYPAPLHACRTALRWAVREAAALRIDPRRIVLAGKSAGGGLAAALALLLRDEGGPAPLGQLLLSPMLDDRGTTPSARQAAGHDTWDATSNATAWQAALGPLHRAPDLPPYAAPARARDLAGLPPAYLEVGSAETFRDETTAYAHALWQAGGHAELHVWPGAPHGFDTLAPTAAISRTAAAARRDWLRRLLGRPGAGMGG